jgi:hypothetical protein
VENQDTTVPGADAMKCLPQTKDSVDKALFHLERMACRLGELPMPKDLRHPMHEVFSRLLAAIYEVQAIAYPPPQNHDQVVSDAALFDDIQVKGLPVVQTVRRQ